MILWVMLAIIGIQAITIAVLSGIAALFLSARYGRLAYRDDVEAVKLQVDLNGRRMDAISSSVQAMKDKLPSHYEGER